MALQKNALAVRGFALAMRFAGWLQNLPNRLTPPPFRLVQIGSAFWQSRALYVAARLDIATVLADGQRPVEDIAARVGAQADALYRLLRMLAALGIFREAAPRVFANNRLSAPLREDAPDSVRAMILMHNSPAMSRPWFEQLESCVRDGGVPFRRVHGQDLYDYMDDHAEFDALFSRAMDSVEALSGDSFAQDFDWSRFQRVIDVGGSMGSKSIAILRRHPRVRAVVVDRAQVVGAAAGHWQGRQPPELLARLSFQAGDVLETLPPAGSGRDIYLLSAVLHGFDDDACVKGLRNVAAACGSSGARIALLELVLAETAADFVGAAFDMQMFMGTQGRERTLTDWRRLFERAGLVLEEQVELRSFARLLLLRLG